MLFTGTTEPTLPALLTKYSGDQIKKNEKDGGGWHYGVRGVARAHRGWWVNLSESVHFENLCLDRMIILKLMLKKWVVGMDRDRWRAVVDAVMNLRVP